MSEEETTLFDLYLQLQTARQQPSTKQTNLIRGVIRRLRQSLIAGQTKTAVKSPESSDVSRQLALSLLLNSDDHEPF